MAGTGSLSKHQFADVLAYGPMITPTVVLMHDPFAQRSAPLNFSLGCMWRIDQPNVDAISEGAITSLSQALMPAIEEMPLGAVFEARMTIKPANTMDEWLAQRQYEDEAGHTQTIQHPMVDSFMRHVESGMTHHVAKQPARLMQIDTHIGLRMPVQIKIPARHREVIYQLLRRNYTGSVAALAGMIQEQQQHEYANFRDLARFIEQQYRISGFAPQILDAQDLTDLISESLNPDSVAAVYDPERPLRGSVGVSTPTLDIDSYCTGGLRATVYSLRKATEETYPGMLSAVRKRQDLTIGLGLWQLAHEHPVTVVVQISVPDQEKLKSIIGIKQILGQLFGLGIGGEKRAEVDTRITDFERFAQLLSTGSKKGVHCGVHVIAWHAEGDLEARDRVLKSAFKRLGMEMFREDTICNTMFTQLLPLGKDLRYPDEKKLVQRMRTMPLDNAVHYLPVYGSFRGYDKRTPSVPLLNKRGERVYIDILRDNNRPHCVFFGSNRSGKSAFMNWIANNLVPLGASLIIIDRYGSYADTCNLHGGHHYDFAKQLCFGPFDGPLDENHQAYLINTMIEMCTSTESNVLNTLDYDEVLVLSELLRLWAQHRVSDDIPMLSEFAAYLRTHPLPEYADLADKFALRLSPFYGDGIYAGFIDGPCELRIDRGLWSFDLSALNDSPHLAAVLTTILFRLVDIFVRDPKNLDHPKYFGIDEASFELRSPHSVELIRRGLVAYARFFLSIIIISQQMRDFQGPLGNILRNNCGAFFTFAISADEAQAFVDTFHLPQHCVKIMASLGRDDDCSQGFVYLPGQSGESDGVGGEFVVVGDKEFFTHIGQAQHHRKARELAQNEKELANV